MQDNVKQIELICDLPKEHNKKPVKIVIVSYYVGKNSFSEALCQYADKNYVHTNCRLKEGRDLEKLCSYSSTTTCLEHK